MDSEPAESKMKASEEEVASESEEDEDEEEAGSNSEDDEDDTIARIRRAHFAQAAAMNRRRRTPVRARPMSKKRKMEAVKDFHDFTKKLKKDTGIAIKSLMGQDLLDFSDSSEESQSESDGLSDPDFDVDPTAVQELNGENESYIDPETGDFIESKKVDKKPVITPPEPVAEVAEVQDEPKTLSISDLINEGDLDLTKNVEIAEVEESELCPEKTAEELLEMKQEENSEDFDINSKLKDMDGVSVKSVKTDGEGSESADGKKSENEDEKKPANNSAINIRRNIRDVMDEKQLDASTLAAQRQESERLARVQEQQRIIREVQRQIAINRQNKIHQKTLQLLQGGNSILKKTASGQKLNLPNTVLVKLPSGEVKKTTLKQGQVDVTRLQKATPSGSGAQKVLRPDEKSDKKEVVEIVDSSSGEESSSSSSDSDDCIMLSDSEVPPSPEAAEEDPGNSGLHVNDTYNIPDDQGRVLINLGHPEADEDIFVAPQISRIIKPHQIGGVRFLFDNIIESVERFSTSTGFGCILAHSMGLGKTLQIVCFCDIFLRHTTSKTVLCIMPINTLQNWVAEFNKWLPADAASTPLAASGEVRPRNFPIYVLNDSHKTLYMRAKVVKDWTTTGGVLMIGYELYRLLSMKKDKKPRKKRKDAKSERDKELVDKDKEDKKEKTDAVNEEGSDATNQSKLSDEVKQDNGEQDPSKLDAADEKKEEKKEEVDENQKMLDEMYEALVKPGPDLVICDEGHRIKNSHSNISYALKQMRTKRRVVLTGYPLQNNLLEYWCMVDFVRPNYLGSKTEFCNMFERPIQNGQCIDSTPQDIRLMRYRAHVLHSLLVGFVQRRSHAVLQSTLPQKEEYVLLVRLTPLQRELYERFMSEVVRAKKVPNPLKAFAICCKIWNHPDVLYNFLKKRSEANAAIEEDLDLEEIGGVTKAGRNARSKGPPRKANGKPGRPSKKPAATIPPNQTSQGPPKPGDPYPNQAYPQNGPYGPPAPYRNEQGQYGPHPYGNYPNQGYYPPNQAYNPNYGNTQFYPHQQPPPYTGNTPTNYPANYPNQYPQNNQDPNYNQNYWGNGNYYNDPNYYNNQQYPNNPPDYNNAQPYPPNYNASQTDSTYPNNTAPYPNNQEGYPSQQRPYNQEAYPTPQHPPYNQNSSEQYNNTQQQEYPNANYPNSYPGQYPQPFNPQYDYQSQTPVNQTNNQSQPEMKAENNFDTNAPVKTEPVVPNNHSMNQFNQPFNYNQNPAFSEENTVNTNNYQAPFGNVSEVKPPLGSDSSPLPTWPLTDSIKLEHDRLSDLKSEAKTEPKSESDGEVKIEDLDTKTIIKDDSKTDKTKESPEITDKEKNNKLEPLKTDSESDTDPKKGKRRGKGKDNKKTDNKRGRPKAKGRKDRKKSKEKADGSESEESEKEKLTKEEEQALIKKAEEMTYDWATELLKDYIPGIIENSAKMELFFYILTESIRLGDRILLFSQSLFTLNLIEDFLERNFIPGTIVPWQRNTSYYRLDGSTHALEREKLINEFNSNPNVHLFLVSTRAGSLGINLVGANRVIVFDASWNPCHDTQAVCRVYRYGQKKPCFVYRFVMDCCLEKKIYDRQINKQGMADRVVDECNPDAVLSMKEITNLCFDNDEKEPEIKDLSEHKEKYIDIIMQGIIGDYGKRLTKEPFQHESLLVDRKEKKLSSAEKRLAQRGYELEKKAASAPKPTMAYRTVRAADGSLVQRPVASVRPMQHGARWIPADVWRRQGMTAQEMTLPLDVVIPTNSAEKTNIVLKAGQRVMVLKSPKGIYMQLESGKIIAIKTSLKGLGNKPGDGKDVGNKKIMSRPSPANLPGSLKNNSAITITSKTTPRPNLQRVMNRPMGAKSVRPFLPLGQRPGDARGRIVDMRSYSSLKRMPNQRPIRPNLPGSISITKLPREQKDDKKEQSDDEPQVLDSDDENEQKNSDNSANSTQDNTQENSTQDNDTQNTNTQNNSTQENSTQNDITQNNSTPENSVSTEQQTNDANSVKNSEPLVLTTDEKLPSETTLDNTSKKTENNISQLNNETKERENQLEKTKINPLKNYRHQRLQSRGSESSLSQLEKTASVLNKEGMPDFRKNLDDITLSYSPGVEEKTVPKQRKKKPPSKMPDSPNPPVINTGHSVSHLLGNDGSSPPVPPMGQPRINPVQYPPSMAPSLESSSILGPAGPMTPMVPSGAMAPSGLIPQAGPMVPGPPQGPYPGPNPHVPPEAPYSQYPPGYYNKPAYPAPGYPGYPPAGAPPHHPGYTHPAHPAPYYPAYPPAPYPHAGQPPPEGYMPPNPHW